VEDPSCAVALADGVFPLAALAVAALGGTLVGVFVGLLVAVGLAAKTAPAQNAPASIASERVLNRVLTKVVVFTIRSPHAAF